MRGCPLSHRLGVSLDQPEFAGEAIRFVSGADRPLGGVIVYTPPSNEAIKINNTAPVPIQAIFSVILDFVLDRLPRERETNIHCVGAAAAEYPAGYD